MYGCSAWRLECSLVIEHRGKQDDDLALSGTKQKMLINHVSRFRLELRPTSADPSSSLAATFRHLNYVDLFEKMVAQAKSGKKPLPDMMTSIRITDNGEVEIVDQLLLP